jgi:hypothetical protein
MGDGSPPPKTTEARIALCREILMDDLYDMALPFLTEYGGKAIGWLADKVFNSPVVKPHY